MRRSWTVLAVTAALHGTVLAGVLTVRSKSPVPLPAEVQLVFWDAPEPAMRQLLAKRASLVPEAVAFLAPAAPQAAAPVIPPFASSSPETTPDPPDDALQRYASRLHALIAAARRPGQHRAGTAVLRFEVDRQGDLVTVALQQSSGDPLLDAAALASLRAAAPFPPPPPSLAAAALRFTIPFVFS